MVKIVGVWQTIFLDLKLWFLHHCTTLLQFIFNQNKIYAIKILQKYSLQQCGSISHFYQKFQITYKIGANCWNAIIHSLTLDLNTI